MVVPFAQHLCWTTSGVWGNSTACSMTRKRNYFFMHFRGDSRASFWPNGPFVLLPQVFLIKNVISLINCLTALAAGPIVFVALCLHWLSQGTESKRKHGMLFLLSLPVLFFSLPFVGEWQLVYYWGLFIIGQLSQIICCQSLESTWWPLLSMDAK